MYLKIGENAPDFKLINYNGELISLSYFKDTQIILWFFPKANTPG
jgi:peroxiredoxin Q/BCP